MYSQMIWRNGTLRYRYPIGPVQRYVVMDAREKMPNSCWGGRHYRRVAVVETTGRQPRQIHPMHTSTIARIVRTWERVYEGSTSRCSFQVALDEAHTLCAALNAAA